MMNIVQEVLSCVLWFSSQSALVSSTSSANNTYRAMCDTHRKFSNAARLLIKGELVCTMSSTNYYIIAQYTDCTCSAGIIFFLLVFCIDLQL